MKFSQSWLVALSVTTWLGAQILTAGAFAQSMSEWSPLGGGDYLDAANWTPQNVPGDVCCDESALFSTPGTRTIMLTAGMGLTLDNLESTNGTQIFELPPASVLPTTIEVSGELSVDRSNLTLGLASGAPISLNVPGQTELIDGAHLGFMNGAELTASVTNIATGKFDHTELSFFSGSMGQLGVTSLGNNPPIDAPIGGIEKNALLTLQNGSHVRTGDFQVGTAAVAERVSAVQILGGILEQDADATIVLGNADDVGDALLAISSGATAQYGSLIQVNKSGRVINASGHAEFGGDLTINGSSIGYRELGTASREFASDTTITISAGGGALFAGADVEFVGQQTLAILDTQSSVSIDTGLVLNNSSTIELTYDDTGITDPMITVSGQVDLAGTLEVTFAPTAANVAVGESVPLLSATGGFVGAFDSVTGPSQPGTAWVWETIGDTLFMSAVESSQGDYNVDGQVDAADYTLWRDTLGSTSLLDADGNGNGTVDAADYQIWRTNFETLSDPVTTVPEPYLAWLILAWMALPVRRTDCRRH